MYFKKMSSINDTGYALLAKVAVCRLDINNTCKRGPRTLLCGFPVFIRCESDVSLLTFIQNCKLLG